MEYVNIVTVHSFKLTESALFQTAYNFQKLVLKTYKLINAYHVSILINLTTKKIVLSQVAPTILQTNVFNVKLDSS